MSDENTKFLVDLGIKLREDQAKHIESQIQDIIKNELVKADTSGDRGGIESRIISRFTRNGLPPGYYGLVVKPPRPMR